MTAAKQWVRIAAILAVIGTALAVALLGLRVGNSVSDPPPQIETSGYEAEIVYPIWQRIHGQPVYTDRLAPPFNAVVYNWLLYESYAAFGKAALTVTGLGEEWLPTITRTMTLLGVVVGALAAARAFAAGTKGWQRVLLAAYAIYVTAGPLQGWFAFSTRSDIWALACEAVAVALFLSLYPRHRLTAALSALLAGYAAFAFKQMSIYALGAVFLVLLLRRDWRAAALFALGGMALLLLTFTLGSPQFVHNLLFADFTLVFSAPHGLKNVMEAARATTPTLLPLAGLLWLAVRSSAFRRAAWADHGMVAGLAGTALGLCLAVPASFQTGAAVNYYFPLLLFATLAAARGLVLAAELQTPLLHRLSAAGWGLFAIAVLVVLSGLRGITDLHPYHALNSARTACLQGLPGPLYVQYPFHSLPWLSSSGPPYFLVSFQYPVERAAGKPFQGNGIGGMIERGELKTVALIADRAPESFDGASLARYRQHGPVCETMVVLVHDSVDPASLPLR